MYVIRGPVCHVPLPTQTHPAEQKVRAIHRLGVILCAVRTVRLARQALGEPDGAGSERAGHPACASGTTARQLGRDALDGVVGHAIQTGLAQAVVRQVLRSIARMPVNDRMTS